MYCFRIYRGRGRGGEEDLPMNKFNQGRGMGHGARLANMMCVNDQPQPLGRPMDLEEKDEEVVRGPDPRWSPYQEEEPTIIQPSSESSPINEMMVKRPEGEAITPEAQLTFHARQIIGRFYITKDRKYAEEGVDIPKIASFSQSDILELRRRYLGEGYVDREKVKHDEDGFVNYMEFHWWKQLLICQWMNGTNFFNKVQQKVFKKPQFVCMGSIIGDTLQTPVLKAEYPGQSPIVKAWGIFAARFNGMIFLRDTNVSRRTDGTLDAHSALVFEALLTEQDPTAVNQFERAYSVEEVTFGGHQLLLVNELDAVSGKGEFVKIQAIKRELSQHKMASHYLNCWAQGLVAGMEKLIIGERLITGYLRSTQSHPAITRTTTGKVLEMTSVGEEVSTCLDFQDRLLTWIASHFDRDDPNLVRKFSWGGFPCKKVECEIAKGCPGESFIPEYFMDVKGEKGTKGAGAN